MGTRRSLRLDVLFRLFDKQPRKVKIPATFLCLIVAVVAVNLLVDNRLLMLFLVEVIQGFGTIILVYKLVRSKACPGISLRAQVLTALCIFTRIPGDYMLVRFEHLLVDLCQLVSTALVIFQIWRKRKSTNVKELDNFPIIYTIVGAAALAFLIPPDIKRYGTIAYFWAFSTYLKAVSVLPQLHLMHNEKMVQPITAHYVFAIGVGRFLGLPYWVAMVYRLKGRFLYLVGYGALWLSAAFLSEIIHSFILADFCYYYVKASLYDKLVGELSTFR